jgi:hypothetical protein
MPKKSSVGPNEVVRLEVLRLTPPLEIRNTRRLLRFGICDKNRLAMRVDFVYRYRDLTSPCALTPCLMLHRRDGLRHSLCT